MHYSLLRQSVMPLHKNQTDGSEVNAVYKEDMPVDHTKESVTTSVMTHEKEHFFEKKPSKIVNNTLTRRIGWWIRE